MYEILIGELSSDRKQLWNNGRTDPYAVVASALFCGSCNMGTLQEAGRYFTDEIQVDWGCFAWKATKADLIKFFRRKGYPVEEISHLDQFKEYAVVYIDR